MTYEFGERELVHLFWMLCNQMAMIDTIGGMEWHHTMKDTELDTPEWINDNRELRKLPRFQNAIKAVRESANV